MRRSVKVALVAVGLITVTGAVAVDRFLAHGVSARDQPTALEAFVARRLRHLAVPRAPREAGNPLPLTPETLASARAHFADHCASCHGNDGRGRTPMGQSLYPKAPDMTLDDTQHMSDGALFWIIKNGVRLTGMPAWGKDTPDDARQTWELVHLIRHLPKITPEELREMEALNPRSPKEIEEELQMKRFLEGGDAGVAPPVDHTKH
jgi:mono/diheme cytochrome c family protein